MYIAMCSLVVLNHYLTVTEKQHTHRFKAQNEVCQAEVCQAMKVTTFFSWNERYAKYTTNCLYSWNCQTFMFFQKTPLPGLSTG